MKKSLFISLAVFFLTFSACKQAGSTVAETNNANETAADQSEPKAKAELLAAARKFTELPFVSATVEWVKVIDGKDLPSSQIVEYVAPNRSRNKWLVKLGDQDEMEYIGMGKTVYAKTCWKCPGGGKWSKISEDGGFTSNVKDLFSEPSLRRLADVKYEGEETIDGKKASVYSYKNQAFRPILDAVDFMTASTSKIWVSSDKGVPLKLRTEFGDSPVRSLDIVFDVEKPLKIEAPPISQ